MRERSPWLCTWGGRWVCTCLCRYIRVDMCLSMHVDMRLCLYTHVSFHLLPNSGDMQSVTKKWMHASLVAPPACKYTLWYVVAPECRQFSTQVLRHAKPKAAWVSVA